MNSLFACNPASQSHRFCHRNSPHSSLLPTATWSLPPLGILLSLHKGQAPRLCLSCLPRTHSPVLVFYHPQLSHQTWVSARTETTYLSFSSRQLAQHLVPVKPPVCRMRTRPLKCKSQCLVTHSTVSTRQRWGRKPYKHFTGRGPREILD